MTPDARAAFAAALRADPGHTLVACDFDGTLAPIVADPAQARPAPGAAQALTRLAAAGVAVRIITGRPAAKVVELGGLDTVPGLVVLGLYGAQRWFGGTLTTAEPAPGLAGAQTLLELVLAGAAPGVRLESKGLSVAVHTRQAADPSGELERLRPAVEAIAASTGMHVEPGRYVLELRSAGSDKGAALLASVTEIGARCVLFAGDDLGDLAAFSAVRSLTQQGIVGLAVASACDEAPVVAAAADWTVAGPLAVVQLLDELAQLVE